MRFELSEQSYLVSFQPSEGRWYLVTPGDRGLNAIPVINDEDSGTKPDVIVPSVHEETMIIN